MTVTTVPPHVHRRDPWLAPRVRKLAGLLAASLSLTLGVALAPHRASLRRLSDIPLTVAGIACADFAAFHLAHGWGWLVTGISLAVLEHMIADDSA